MSWMTPSTVRNSRYSLTLSAPEGESRQPSRGDFWYRIKYSAKKNSSRVCSNVPIVIVTFEQTRDEFFFAEYFILYQKSPLDGCRLSPSGAESVKEYLEFRTVEGVIQDMRDAAQAEIEGKVVKSLPKEQQYQWIRLAAYTLTPIEFDEL